MLFVCLQDLSMTFLTDSLALQSEIFQYIFVFNILKLGEEAVYLIKQMFEFLLIVLS